MRLSLIFACILIVPLFLFSQEESDWKFVRQQKGIDVFVKTIPQSPDNAVKATTVIDCSLASAVAVLLDVPNHTKWMFQSKKAEIIEFISDTSYYYYAQTKAIWPVSDRDFVSKIVISQIKNGYLIKGTGIPDYIPEKEDFVRVPYSVSQWKFVELDKNKTYVELYIAADVGGNVPPWILNMFISRGPYQTLLNFKIMTHKSRYRHADLSKLAF